MRITEAFGSFSVPDIDAARDFYRTTLGLDVASALPDGGGPLWLSVGGERRTMVYSIPGHQPAKFTVLNLSVANIAGAVDELAGRGVQFERYPEYEQDERGIFHGAGHDIAWFRDPAGNSLSLVQLHP
jgi:catechol 2,3-dioxygenase-like lactoylglutathione lyase family enzyme